MSFFSEAESFLAAAAPNLEATIVNDAKSALATIEAAFAPVAEAGADQIVTLVLSKVGGSAETALSIAFVNSVIEALTAKLPH